MFVMAVYSFIHEGRKAVRTHRTGENRRASDRAPGGSQRQKTRRPSEEGRLYCPGENSDVSGTPCLLPRRKGIYHAGCTGYPNPTYP